MLHIQETKFTAHTTHSAGALFPVYPGQPELCNPCSAPLVHQHPTAQGIGNSAFTPKPGGGNATSSMKYSLSPPVGGQPPPSTPVPMSPVLLDTSFAYPTPHPLLPLSSFSLSTAMRSQPLPAHPVGAQEISVRGHGKGEAYRAATPTLTKCHCWFRCRCSRVTYPSS